jgi:hypothetical protein
VINAIYNLAFHPLRGSPGPWLWAATRIPWCWYQYKGVCHRRILELHEEFGPSVRVAPTEMSYVNDTAWKEIYGQKKDEMGKDPVFSLLTPNGAQSWCLHDSGKDGKTY